MAKPEAKARGKEDALEKFRMDPISKYWIARLAA